MQFSLKAVLAAATLVASVMANTPTSSYPLSRLRKEDCALLIVDHQAGLFGLARDFDVSQFYHAVQAHAAIALLFPMPVIMTTSTETGPNGPLLKSITDMYPNETVIARPGEVDAWTNPDFRAAVEATGKKQVILAGIVTEACTTMLALSLRAAGYEVFANVEASATTSQLIRDVSNLRMANAGVQLMSLFSILGELMGDWRGSVGADKVLPWVAKYYPPYIPIAQAHAFAVKNGTVVPGQEDSLDNCPAPASALKRKSK